MKHLPTKRFLFVTLAVLLVTLPGMPLIPSGTGVAAAQSGVTWAANYYSNAYLIGSPVRTENISAIAFNWGLGSPGDSVPVDGWSARYVTDPYFAAGTYRFYALADDGVRLSVDFLPLGSIPIDTLDAPQPGQLIAVDVELTAGQHHIVVDFRENTETAYIYFTWEPVDGSMAGPNFPAIPTPVKLTNSWTAQYYNNTNLTGNAALAQTEAGPSHDWGLNAPGAGITTDYWSARWSSLQTLEAGEYKISVRADDGVRVYFNGTPLINEWHVATGQTYTATFTTFTGQHSFTVEYYDDTVNAELDFRIERPAAPAAAPAAPAAPPAATNATARVTAWALNVRSAPVTGSVLTKIKFGEVYNVVGRNQASSWWLLNVNGTYGWASGAYLDVTNATSVPVNTGGVVQPVPTPSPTPAAVQCAGFLPSRVKAGGYGRVLAGGLPNNVRVQPNTFSAITGQIPPGGVFSIISGPVCAENAAWWQVSYFGLTGWTMEGQNNVYWLERYIP